MKQGEAHGTKCHRKVKENEEGLSDGVFLSEECLKTSLLSWLPGFEIALGYILETDEIKIQVSGTQEKNKL